MFPLRTGTWSSTPNTSEEAMMALGRDRRIWNRRFTLFFPRRLRLGKERFGVQQAGGCENCPP
jgi:hypothetical protein